MLNNEFIIAGYSGHGLVVADTILGLGLPMAGYIDLEEKIINPYSLKFLGSEDELEDKYWKKPFTYILGIGNNYLRSKLAHKIELFGGELGNIFHKTSFISKSAKFGKGNFASANSIVNPLAIIGDNCIINSGSIIEHECIISNNVHIAPGAVLAGNVQVGENSFIGANSVIKEGIKIGRNVVIGAGSVIIRNIEDDKKCVGNPGIELN